MHGSKFSWLYNLLLKAFKSKIEDDIKSALSGAALQAVGDLNHSLATLNVNQPLSPHLNVSWALVDAAFFSAAAAPTQRDFVVDLAGTFSGSATQARPAAAAVAAAHWCGGGAPPTLPSAAPDNTHDVYFAFSQYSLCSALVATYKAQLLDVVINASDVPPTSPIQLNTTFFRALVPSLYAKYPNQLMRGTQFLGNKKQLSRFLCKKKRN